MQEEVENRTVNLVISTSRLTTRVLIRALGKYLNRIEHKKQTAKSERRQVRMAKTLETEKLKARYKAEGPHGRQSIKQLMHSGNELKHLPVQTEHLKEFEKVVRKYGVDFAVTKGMYEGQPRYLVFFKAKDAALLSDIYQECITRQLHKKDPEQRPSVLKVLANFKAITEKTPMKIRQKELSR